MDAHFFSIRISACKPKPISEYKAKIYRWQDGEWTRLVAARDEGPALSPPDVFSPFLSMDGSVVGWQINVGCILCQIVVGPPLSSEISGVSLPAAFPRGTVRMS